MTPSRTFIVAARVVGLAWILGGIGMILITGARVVAGWGSENWPHVTGRVVNSSLSAIKNASGGVAFYKVQIIYAYSPPSSDKYEYAFQGSHLAYQGFADPADDSYTLQQAQQLTSNYPVGKSVTVYYSRSDMQKSILQPGINFGSFTGVLIGIALMLLGTLLFLKFITMPTS